MGVDQAVCLYKQYSEWGEDTSINLCFKKEGGSMAKLDIDEYRKMYLSVVEEHLLARKDQIPNFTTENLHRAIMTEMNRADEETWEVEVPDDKDKAIEEAEKRCMDFFETHKDYDLGKAF